MFTTNDDILAASLVLQDVIHRTGQGRDDLSELLAENKLAKHYLKLEEMIAAGRKSFNQRWNRRFVTNTPLEDYKFLYTLGTGAFGNVVLAKRGTDFYAAKVLEKRQVVKNKQLTHVHNEVRILDALRFDFLVYLEDFIKTGCYVILVLPFIAGGEMFEYFRKHGKCDEAQARFYAAQVVLAFEFMHGIGVIYRDLKPENIMMDESGYIKITDFGFCKKVDNQRTWSLCGTPEYLAPEIILNQGYNRSVDWWAFGILVYEMTAGHPPFISRDPMKLYDKIISGYFTFPTHFSNSLQNLLSNVIQVDKTKRFGVLKDGTKDIKSHPWFRSVDWNAILERSAASPYKPKVEAPGDTSNFDVRALTPLRDCPEEEYAEEFAVIGAHKSVEPQKKALFPSRSKTKGFFTKPKK